MKIPSLWRCAALLFVIVATLGLPQTSQIVRAQDPEPPRTVFVHLFEWKWLDVAEECENFLGPKGFSAVQVSPPNEHALVGAYPWWQRYQPVSYQIESRSGTRDQFIEMVQRCDAVGVDIYVDAVINHMTGVGSGTGIAGTSYTEYDYSVYEPWDFHHCGRNGNDDIQNYNDRWEVQNCELVNLADLNTGATYVQDTIAAYLQDLVDIGVTGFRLDASKHMDTNDINAIFSRVNGDYYIFQEVIDQGGEPITAEEYFQNGDVTEFKYSVEIGRVFYEGQLAWLSQFGEAWGFMPNDMAVVFTDNHDNQRGHGGGGHVVTYKDGALYDLANVFMLAWPYGYPKIMSSYNFTDGDQGPPSDGNGNTQSVYSDYNNPESYNCFGNVWQCEHRWEPIANMVEFRNETAADFSVDNWWSNGGNQIAFSRGNSGFVAINKESYTLNRTFQTGLAAGVYCNVLNGQLSASGQSCTGSTVTVNGDGTAYLSVASWDTVAIHVGDKINGGGGDIPTIFNVSNAYTNWGQNIYVVGNIAALGNWNPCSAVQLTPDGYPTWSGVVNLPASTTVEYKYIKYADCGNVTWQSGSNQVFTTPSTGTATRYDAW
ncbi:MAG: alpha amylase C-terminal domain-containing protein [Anaerolineae bacterium]|nr:alpha amylase C-terminal domain-containing protein [Anaerolineae bacterium]